jgi:flagellar biosynthesis GTPase FlhF
MNKYLIEILKLQNSVILPGLGALMIPSQKTGKVFFNEHLKFNDGSLARYLAEKEGVELQEAQNKVAKFVREIEAQIGKGEAYDMFEFGKFFKDETGDVKFEMSPLFIANIEIPNPETLVSSAKSAVIPLLAPSNETEHLATQKEAEAKKAAELEAQNLADQKEAEAQKAAELEAQNLADQKEAEAQKAAELEAQNLATQKEAEAKKAAELEAQNLAAQKEAEAKKAAESINEVVPEIVAEPINTAKIVPPVIATPTAVEDKQSKNSFVPQASKPAETAPTDKKRRTKLPLILLLLLLIGLCVVGFIFKDQITGYFDKSTTTNSDSSATSTAPIVAEDTTANVVEEPGTRTETITTDSLTTPEEVLEEPVAPEPVQTSTSGRFHLIGNSFGEKANAEKYVSQLSEKGFSASIIGRFDGLYLVSVKGYDTKEAGKNDLENVRKDVPKAWLFELKD